MNKGIITTEEKMMMACRPNGGKCSYRLNCLPYFKHAGITTPEGFDTMVSGELSDTENCLLA